MKARETTIKEMLGGADRQFVVPRFQRKYSWRRPQWDTLWDDISELYQSSTSRAHFLGSVVTLVFDPRAAGVSKFLLIDGQQRFVTLVLLLCAIRDRARQSGNDRLGEQIEEAYMFNKFANGLDRWKLLPTEDDLTAYQNVLQQDASEAEGRIDDAFRYVKDRLDDTDPEGDPWDLERLFSVVVQRLEIVSIELDADDNPQLIFESLNAKGTPLTQADLVRNYYLLRVTTDHQRQMYEDVWLPMERLLGDYLTEFIRHYLSKDGEFVSKSTVYETLKNRLADRDDREVRQSLSHLASFAKFYERMVSPEAERRKGIAARLQHFNQWDVGVVRPILLNLYRWEEEGTLGLKDFREICRLMEGYVVRRTFAGYKTNPLNRYFIGLSGAIDLANPVDCVGAYLAERGWPGDGEFREAFRRFRLYESGTSRVRLVLESLEDALGHKERVDLSRLTIEHVMPQGITAEWKRMLGGTWKVDHEELLHTVGNLTLSGYNPELSNRDFRWKRAELKKSKFGLNKWISRRRKWTRAEIEARAGELVGYAVKIWPGPDRWN